jgi:hypothetical protein
MHWNGVKIKSWLSKSQFIYYDPPFTRKYYTFCLFKFCSNKLRDDTEVGGSMISRTRSVEDYSRAWTERQQHLHFNRSTRVNYNDISPGPMKLKNPGSSIDLLSLTEGDFLITYSN